MPDFMGGWDSVYDHNRAELTPLHRHLGSNAQSSVIAAFIGTVMDRLDPTNNTQHAAVAMRDPGSG